MKRYYLNDRKSGWFVEFDPLDVITILIIVAVLCYYVVNILLNTH